MTGLQLFGMAVACLLLDDLARWIQVKRIPLAHRPRQVRHALYGVAGPVIWGGLWVLFTLQEGTAQGPPVPWWLTTLVVAVALALLGRLLLALRRTIWIPREGA